MAPRFGTSGWRGRLGDEVTFERSRALVQGISSWLGRSPARVLVGYDGRLASLDLARDAGAVLAEAGHRPLLADRALPTPVLASSVRPRRAAAALVFTASHNPALDHGLKIFDAGGAALDERGLRRIEVVAARAWARGPGPPRAPAPAASGRFLESYRRRLLERIDTRAVARARPKVIYDAMHGAGAGVLGPLLTDVGAKCDLLRAEPDARFGGAVPDPAAPRLGALRRQLRRAAGRPVLGLATDGDADRLAALDETGRALSETELVALLVDHLAETGRLRGGVAITHATGSLVERAAAAHGVPVVRTGIGFKYLARALEAGAAVAGDESGGFAWRALGRDKDGLASACLLVECVALRRSALSTCMRELRQRLGRACCGRRSVVADARRCAQLAGLAERLPERFDDSSVQAVDLTEGVRLQLSDGFAMWRASGTEPVIRIYAEAAGPRRLARRLASAARWLDAAPA